MGRFYLARSEAKAFVGINDLHRPRFNDGDELLRARLSLAQMRDVERLRQTDEARSKLDIAGFGGRYLLLDHIRARLILEQAKDGGCIKDGVELVHAFYLWRVPPAIARIASCL